MKKILGIIGFGVGTVMGKFLYEKYGIIILLVFGVLLFLPFFIRKIRDDNKKIEIIKTKIKIVNDEKYINLKKDERIVFLHDLKQQTKRELLKRQEELEKENNKWKDFPGEIAVYIKPKDTSAMKRKILSLEIKIIAIEELIEAENNKNPKEPQDPKYSKWYWN